MNDAPAGERENIQLLTRAAEVAGKAPSILNTQPWRWVVRDGVARLYADRSRQLRALDPDGRLLR